MARALLLIDLSNDFVRLDGALNCGEAGQAIIPYCEQLVQEFIEQGDWVIDARDAHDLSDPEIASGLFPPHNLVHTAGQQLIAPLATLLHRHPDQWIQISKKHYNALFGTRLDEVLKTHQIDEVHVVGVCTDICVRYTVNGLYQFKCESCPTLRIVVHEGGVASFNQRGHEDTLEHLPVAFGAEVV